MVRTAINLYSVRELDLPTREILERVADAGYDGVQFAGEFGDLTLPETAATLEDLGLAVADPHVDIDDVESDADSAVTASTVIGAGGVVVSWLGPEHFESRSAAESMADRLDDLAATLADHDFTLHYHNHDHEFVDVDGTTGFEVFADASAVLLEPDVGWIRTAGHDPVDVIDSYGDRIEQVHMKDMADGEFCEIGDGDVDMQASADAARDADAEWLVYEHDDPDDPAASLDHGATFLDDL